MRLIMILLENELIKKGASPSDLPGAAGKEPKALEFGAVKLTPFETGYCPK